MKGRYVLPWNLLIAAVMSVSAYLSVVNLDHSHLWEDEGGTAVVGATLLRSGDITGWDGRNLVGCPEALCLNSDGRIVLPPVMFILTAVGIAVAGDDAVGYRIMHALCGLLSLGVIWALLRRLVPESPRFHFFAMAMIALSPQLLMYFRASRYFAFSVLAMAASVYAYERWWEHRERRWLIALSAITVLAFLNHYAIGLSGATALVLAHLLFRGRETTRNDLVSATLAGLAVLLCCLGYFWWIGVLGEGRWGIPGYSDKEHEPTMVGAIYRMIVLARGLFRADWLSWWATPLLFLAAVRRGSGGQGTNRVAMRLAALGCIGIGVSVLVEHYVTKHPIHWNAPGHLRYTVFALPLLLMMKAMLVEQLWIANRWLGAVVLAALVGSSIGSFPLTIAHHPPLRSDLADFAAEVHRPYVDGLRLVGDHLRANAQPGQIIRVEGAPMMSEALIASLGDRYRFCCVVPRTGGGHVDEAARGQWATHVWEGTRADWVVSSVRGGDPRWWQDSEAPGEWVTTLLDAAITSPNPQRPEIHWHHFRAPRQEATTAVTSLHSDAVPEIVNHLDREMPAPTDVTPSRPQPTD